ncbi:nucleotide sugar dehydrogenase [Candidatus Parcubacteria bacterium]|nr:nucleotide sugar dehydrogenase [Candidatus Parcubacteria bacterium]
MSKKNKLKQISVIGLGYVGLPLALLVDIKGYSVVGIDIDTKKIELIKKRISPFEDKAISKQLKQSRIEVTDDFSRLKDSSIVIICVPTPVYKNHMPNLELVKSASEKVGEHLKKGQLVILESTVNPGVSEGIVQPILERTSGLKSGKDFYLAHCPERINPGDEKWNVRNIDRVVGALSDKGLKIAVNFYRSIIDGDIKSMKSIKEAEAVKVVENSFRDINIAFVNELAMSFEKLGIDVVNVIEGAATKPFAFMPHFPGCGVGGHCIPVDPYYLIEYAKKKGFIHDFLALARRINSQMPEYAVEQVVKGLNEKKKSINGAKVAVLGLSYKPDIGDYRESPSFEIIKLLKSYGAKVASYDPFVLEKSSVKSLKEALKGAEAVVVATGHAKFKKISPKIYIKNGVKVVVDGRNCLNKEKFQKAGLVYKGIGR